MAGGNNDGYDQMTSLLVYGVVILSLIGAVSASIVAIALPSDISHTNLTMILGFVAPTITAMIALLTNLVLKRLKSLEVKVNGRISELMDVNGKMERMIGRHEGTQAGQAQAIVDSAEEAIWSKDMKGNILSWNKTCEQLLGWNAVEILGRSIFSILPEDDREHEKGILDALSKGQRLERVKIRRKRKDGNIITLLARIMPIRDSEGNIIAIASMAYPENQDPCSEETFTYDSHN